MRHRQTKGSGTDRLHLNHTPSHLDSTEVKCSLIALGPTPDCPAAQGWTGGRVADPAVFRHVGWPNPDSLTPVPPFGFCMMSKMILSGCVESRNAEDLHCLT